jgi:hypothetical protein
VAAVAAADSSSRRCWSASRLKPATRTADLELSAKVAAGFSQPARRL